MIKRSTVAFLRSICGAHKSPKDYTDVDKSKKIQWGYRREWFSKVKAASEFSRANAGIVLNTPETSKLAGE